MKKGEILKKLAIIFAIVALLVLSSIALSVDNEAAEIMHISY